MCNSFHSRTAFPAPLGSVAHVPLAQTDPLAHVLRLVRVQLLVRAVREAGRGLGVEGGGVAHGAAGHHRAGGHAAVCKRRQQYLLLEGDLKAAH